MFAVLNITDKIIMTGLGLRVRSFLLFIGFQTLLTVAIIAAVNPFPSMSAETFARGLGAGLLWGVGSPLILWSLSREEVSRVTPISQSHPLLVVILAIVGTTPMIVFFATMALAWKLPLLLQETLTVRLMAQKMIAAGMVVSGVVIIALA